ncbi:hypothetical protein L2E82_26796 [Cichorium intybus]|uniref:Uncharacterized protein n=1 Tax=Cichorium intybus TaxID=13427 RepID=A0ACB9CR71_CICIN|nr:hypothetical protein L2E82_26796 [Cichorium intybus]
MLDCGIVLQRGADSFRISGSSGAHNQLQYTVANDVHIDYSYTDGFRLMVCLSVAYSDWMRKFEQLLRCKVHDLKSSRVCFHDPGRYMFFVKIVLNQLFSRQLHDSGLE